MTLNSNGLGPGTKLRIAHSHIVGDAMQDALRQDDSPFAAAEPTDSRGAPRLALLIRSAKLTSPDGEFLCVVRDASETGVSVRLFHPLPARVPLTLEMPNGDRYPLERVWEETGRAGFRFQQAADIARIVEGPSEFARRGVRVRLEVACDLVVGARRVSAMIRNLSQQGALIHTVERLSLIQRVRIHASGMPEIAAKVRWRRGDNYGLGFEDTFQFAELAALAFELQRAGQRDLVRPSR